MKYQLLGENDTGYIYIYIFLNIYQQKKTTSYANL